MNSQGFIDLDFAKLDVNRQHRRGLPEIIYALGKTDEQLYKITREFKKHSKFVLISRLDVLRYKLLKRRIKELTYFSQARLGFIGQAIKGKKGGCLVITAGTSDMAAAEEAAVFLELTGNKVQRIYDVGVSGIHRLMPYRETIKQAKIIIVAAGMEAALLSVVSGMTKAPVIGLPTSVGYGASFQGITALLGMLNSCSLGSVVVNIDNGLGAGYFANLINNDK
jgi:hypothetical protein